MQAPIQIVPQGLADYLDVLTRVVFQSGMSWRVVETKRSGFRAAFEGFGPAAVATFSDDDVERLEADTSIIRNRRKIEATVTNAEAMLAIENGEQDRFRGWLRSRGDLEATVAALRSEFRHLGDTVAYYFLYVVGEPVPAREEWMKTHAQHRR